jgi:hypothetical protein
MLVAFLTMLSVLWLLRRVTRMHMGLCGQLYVFPRCFTAAFLKEELHIMEMNIAYVLYRNSRSSEIPSMTLFLFLPEGHRPCTFPHL